MDPLSNFGPGGLGNEAHLGGMGGSLFPSSSAGTWDSSTSDGGSLAPRGPSLGTRIGYRIFGSSWGLVSKTVTWMLRLGGAGAGFYYGGHYALPWTGTFHPELDPNIRILACAGVGAVLGLIAPTLIRIFLPLILLCGGIGFAVWFFLN